MTVQIEALAVAEQLHRAARHAIFPRAKIVACTPCIEQAHALAPFITAIEQAAKAAGWDEGFTRGFYDVLAGGDRDASESAAENPYRIEREGQA